MADMLSATPLQRQSSLSSHPAVRLETGRDGACQQSTAQRMGREGDKVCGDGEMMCVVCISTCPQLAVLCGQPPDAPRAGGVLG